MMIARISDTTRTLGQQQGYLGLPIKDDVIDGVPQMTSAWECTPEEAARIAAGARIYVTLLGTQHPPIILQVGKVPA